MTDRADDFAEVRVIEHDQNVEPQKLLTRYSGWIAADALADEVERHVFHFEPREATPNRWIQQCEVRFECYWAPPDPRPTLQPAQQGWLDQHLGALR